MSMDILGNLQSLLGGAESGASGAQSPSEGGGLGALAGMLLGGGDRKQGSGGGGGLGALAGMLLGGGQNTSSSSGITASSGSGGGLAGLLTPAVLGGIASALFAKKGGNGGGGLGGLLSSLMGGGASAGGEQADGDGRALRLMRALVYAAKSDGQIDDQERAAIEGQLQKLHMGPESRALLQRIMAEPADPSVIAGGVTDPSEAVQIYVLSRAVINVDQDSERKYLDALASALRIPADIRSSVEAKLGQ